MRKWLVKQRKQQRLTQKQLAERINITRQMISAIENGRAHPSVKLAKSIAQILNFDWTLFFE